jgi:hypothetical protein
MGRRYPCRLPAERATGSYHWVICFADHSVVRDKQVRLFGPSRRRVDGDFRSRSQQLTDPDNAKAIGLPPTRTILTEMEAQNRGCMVSTSSLPKMMTMLLH